MRAITVNPWRNPRLEGRIPELDGIRGLAILLVLIFHYFVDLSLVVKPFRGPVRGSWQAISLAPLGLTWSGVDLFFVLSGFLIAGILYDAKDSPNYYRTFYCRRIFRIFPLYFLWIALFLGGLHFVGPHSADAHRAIFNRDLPVWSYPLFSQNFIMAANHSTFGPAWMKATWSLAVEEQFYLLLPLLIRNLNYQGMIGMAVAAISSAPIFRFLLMHFVQNPFFGQYTLLPSRADALGFGVLLALVCRNEKAWAWLCSHRRHLYAAFLLLGCGVVVLSVRQGHLFQVGLTWLAAFYASLLLLTLVNPGRVEAVCFRSQVLVKLGTVAYGVYIIHLGVNALFHLAVFSTRPRISNCSSLAVTFLSLMTVMLLAALSWRFLEKPLIRHAHSTYRYVAAT